MSEKYINFLMDASQASDNSSTCRLQKYRCLQRQVECGPLARALQQLPPSAEFCCRSRRSPLELDTIRPNPSTHPSATQTVLNFKQYQTLDMLCVSCLRCLEQICLRSGQIWCCAWWIELSCCAECLVKSPAATRAAQMASCLPLIASSRAPFPHRSKKLTSASSCSRNSHTSRCPSLLATLSHHM